MAVLNGEGEGWHWHWHWHWLLLVPRGLSSPVVRCRTCVRRAVIGLSWAVIGCRRYAGKLARLARLAASTRPLSGLRMETNALNTEPMAARAPVCLP